jgi:hypothetical protein
MQNMPFIINVRARLCSFKLKIKKRNILHPNESNMNIDLLPHSCVYDFIEYTNKLFSTYCSAGNKNNSR